MGATKKVARACLPLTRPFFAHPNTSKRLLRGLRRVINPKRSCVCRFFFFLIVWHFWYRISALLYCVRNFPTSAEQQFYISRGLFRGSPSLAFEPYFLLLLLFFSSRVKQKRWEGKCSALTVGCYWSRFHCVCSSLQLITFPCVMAVLIQRPPFHLKNVVFFSVNVLNQGGLFKKTT